MWIDILPYLLAATVGFRHAFELDHLAAVSNIVTKRNSPVMAMKDGVFWGLGHSSSILVVGIVMLMLRYAIPEKSFQMMEGGVGLMIIGLGVFRYFQFRKHNRHTHTHTHDGITDAHEHSHVDGPHHHTHKLSYGVGIIHGLAGSGVLIAAAMAAMTTIATSLLFLLIFSIGCTMGMLVAAGILSLPFSKKLQSFRKIQMSLVVFSCIICLLLGTQIMMNNWF